MSFTSIRSGATVAMAFVVAGLAAGCDRGEPGVVPEPREPVAVDVVRPTGTRGAVLVPATVRATDRAALATRASGTVRRVPVDVGSVVAAGDVLLVLDATDVDARIAAAEAELDRASRYAARIAPLHADGAATGQELDDARARVRVAEAEVAAARAQRSYAVLRAPFAGRVTSRDVNPGDLAVPGRPVLTLAGTGGLEITADLPAGLEGRVRAGDPLRVVDPARELDATITVARVAPALESTSRSFRIVAPLPAGAGAAGLVPGAFVRLAVPDPEGGTIEIPARAIVRRGQLSGVFTVERDSAWIRWIRPGTRRGDMVEVLSGLGPEERIVAEPSPSLRDGTPVR